MGGEVFCFVSVRLEQGTLPLQRSKGFEGKKVHRPVLRELRAKDGRSAMLGTATMVISMPLYWLI